VISAAASVLPDPRKSGSGHILNGNVLVAQCVYDVEVHQNYVETGHLAGRGVASPGQTVKCALSAFSALLPPRDTLTLVMSDKRKLNFYNKGGGQVTVMGAIYD
jgi:hypothetical protein